MAARDASYEHVLFNHADNRRRVGRQRHGHAHIHPHGWADQRRRQEHRDARRPSHFNVQRECRSRSAWSKPATDTIWCSTAAFKGTTIHAYRDDDGVTTSDVVFNGPVTLTGFNEAKFMTGTGAVTFNSEVLLDHTAGNSGFGIRNGMTAVARPRFHGAAGEPRRRRRPGPRHRRHVQQFGLPARRRQRRRLRHRPLLALWRPGSGHDPNNTLDLNGHSDTIELLGTHPGRQLRHRFRRRDGRQLVALAHDASHAGDVRGS